MVTRESVVVAGLEETDPFRFHRVDQTVLLRDAPRPRTRAEVFEWFWLPKPSERITQNRIHQVEDS